MSNANYPLGLDEFLDGEINYLTDTIKIQMVDASYVYSAAHNALDDVAASSRIGDPVTVTGKSRGFGQAYSDDVVFENVPGGDTVAALVVYQHHASEAAARLIAYIDTFGDSTPIDIDTNDGDLTFTWPNGILFKI